MENCDAIINKKEEHVFKYKQIWRAYSKIGGTPR
jgi:hypothetical protein